jgi:CHRD domain/PEP-CTERM motif
MFQTRKHGLLLAAAALAFSAIYLAPPATASVIEYDAILTGPAESPPNASPGTGSAQVFIDTVANTMRVEASFGGLTTNTIMSHIHCCTAIPGAGVAGVATTVPSFPGFPLGVTSGTYDHTFNVFDSTTYNPAFVTANGGTAASAFAALLLGLNAGEAYLNIHTTQFPWGEIRGFLVATPLPAALPLFASGLGVLGLFGWRRKRCAGMTKSKR